LGIEYKVVGDGYECTKEYIYLSPRYNKFIIIPVGFYSDGATGAIDVNTVAWWVHDHISRYGEWSDGTKITNWQASTVLSDILKDEGFWFRTYTWWIATFLFGGGAARENGLI
jgi:hypothetical protein